LARKTGQIVGRGRQRWLVRIFLGRDRETCKRRYHSRIVRGPVRHAQTYLNKVLRDRDLGRQVDGADITLDEYLDRWLETAAKPRLREKSYRSYESLLRRYVRPALGPRNLAICPLDIQAVYQKLVERGLSARTVRYTHSVLRSSMRQAIRWRLLAEDPTDGAQLPRLRRREMRALTAEQSRVFLETVMQTPYGPVLAVALTTAARPSEYLALKWQDINWERGTASIVRTLERVSGGWRFAETKRARSRRVIKLQEWVLELLEDLRAERKPRASRSSWPGAWELIFTTPSGRPIDSDNLAKRFKSILEQAGLPLIRLYDLRHTGATLALAAGVPPKVISEQLGHASAAFTLDIYSHVLPHMQEQAAMKVEELLTGRVSRTLA
jgi:integrase